MGLQHKIDDTRIQYMEELLPPIAILEKYPCQPKEITLIEETRKKIHDIIYGEDKRMLVIIGPCSIHDPSAALDYAHRLKKLREKHKNKLEIVMRVYFEKPRTTIGWKGLINDPYLDSSYHINDGLRTARKLLLNIAEMGVPTASEFLDMIVPQYLGDLISWGAIGARTTESQVHRELASGLSCPVGFKNGTDGNIQVAADGVYSANQPHRFLSVNKLGHSAIIMTKGNEDCHIILRGGSKGPNFDAESIKKAYETLLKQKCPPRLMVDCSHANSNKEYKNQIKVIADLIEQRKHNAHTIMGVMLESYLVEGKQNIKSTPLTYGQSITDACIGWEETEEVLASLAASV